MNYIDYKQNHNYIEMVKRFTSPKVADAIINNILFTEKYLPKIENAIPDKQEQHLAYKQLGIMAFSAAEALWKSIEIAIINKCHEFGCNENNCVYRKYKKISDLNFAKNKSILEHLNTTNLLLVMPQDESGIEKLSHLRNHIHLTRINSDGDKSAEFTLSFVDNMLRLFYVTLNQLDKAKEYFNTQIACHKNFDNNSFDKTKALNDNNRKDYYTWKIIGAFFHIINNISLTENDKYYLDQLNLSTSEICNYDVVIDHIGHKLYYIKRDFKSDEQYDRELSRILDTFQQWAPNKSTLISDIKKKKDYYFKLFAEM